MNENERTEPPRTGDERTLLTTFLDFHRDTLEWKCTGLTPEQLRSRASPPSSMSLLGLLRHLSDVERNWFRRGIAGEQAPPIYWSEGDYDGDFDNVDDATQADIDEVWATWRDEVRRAREIAAARSLEDTFERRGHVFSVRWALIHMIEEYARHNGHADLMRERLDGSTGE